MIGNLYKVTLNAGLKPEERNKVFDEIAKIKGVNKDFNKAAKPKGDELFVHTMGMPIDADLRKIKGVKSVFQMPVG